MRQILFKKLLRPRARDEDEKRQELLLDILLLGTVTLSFCALVSALYRQLSDGAAYGGAPPAVLAVLCAIFVFLYVLSRLGLYRWVAYAFIALIFAFAAYPIVIWGILLPQGVLMYSLIIVMSGVLLGSRAAFRMTLLLIASLTLIVHLGTTHAIHFSNSWTKDSGTYSDVAVYGFTFLVIALVSWLSNREIERSLVRAHQSEKELRKERNSLEIKVRERTKELEKAQVEKILELHRFAEFGRFSSTLLHDLANPLTSVSLELEQLADTRHSRSVREARKGIAAMERYVDSARRQLRNQSEIKLFDAISEIERVQGFLESKAHMARVELVFALHDSIRLYGDSIRFNQIIANLIANAIDAYDQTKQPNKMVTVEAKTAANEAIITVTDHGIGIAPDELGHIFEAFYTTKATERGSGLGLAITKQAVEEDFKGTIIATSNKAKGTCFTVHLPLA